jgi:hypothetical protein
VEVREYGDQELLRYANISTTGIYHAVSTQRRENALQLSRRGDRRAGARR